MDFDLVLEEIGDFGRYQQTNYLLLCLPVLFGAANSLSYVFTAGIPNYRCFVPDCDDPVNPVYDQPWVHTTVPGQTDSFGVFTPDQCQRYVSNKPKEIASNGIDLQCGKDLMKNVTERCDRWVFDKTDDYTIVQEWSITCIDNQWKLAFVGTTHFAGIVLGSAAAGVLADNYGRKNVFVLSIMFMALTGIGQAIATNYITFVIFALLNAVGTSSLYPLAFIMAVEMVGPKKREMSGIVLNYFYALGEAAVGLIAWMCHDWVTLQLIVSVPPLFFFVYYWMVPESVRWLMARNNNAKAKKIVQKAASVNKVVLSNYILQSFEPKAADADNENHVDEKIKKELNINEKDKQDHELWRTFKELLSSRVIVVRFVVLFLLWATNAFVFYGLSLNATSLSGNKYLNFILVCLVEIPGYTLSWLAMNKIGRRWAIAGSYFLCSFSCTAGGFVPPEWTWAVVSLFLIGKLGITSAFATSYVHTAEMMPTVVRSICVGAASTIARFGALVAPFVPLLSFIYKPLPLLLFGVISLVVGLLALLLPETLGYRLPDTAEEAELIGSEAVKDIEMNSRVK